MHDAFLQRARAKLAIAKLLGFLDRRIRRKLQEVTEGELWEIRRKFYRRVKELASLDSPGKLPSMGAIIRTWRDHPFKRYLDERESALYAERVRADPKSFWVPSDDMSDEELDSYIAWTRNKPPDSLRFLTVEEKVAMWRREIHRTLPIIPKSGSLPTNSDVGRRPNNRKGGGPSGVAAKAETNKASQAAHTETEGEVFHSPQDCEVH